MASTAWREYAVSFVAAADDAQANLFVLLGKEAGSVWLDSLRLQAGLAMRSRVASSTAPSS